MAPFPEAEDMTIKRLYVALKRSDMQLLQMGAHKLHEKFHTGHKFELLDDLGQILSYVEEQDIPNDIKDLLTSTINDILNGANPNNTPVGAPAFNQAQIPAGERERVIFTPKSSEEFNFNPERQKVRIVTEDTEIAPERAVSVIKEQSEPAQTTLDFNQAYKPVQSQSAQAQTHPESPQNGVDYGEKSGQTEEAPRQVSFVNKSGLISYAQNSYSSDKTEEQAKEPSQTVEILTPDRNITGGQTGYGLNPPAQNPVTEENPAEEAHAGSVLAEGANSASIETPSASGLPDLKAESGQNEMPPETANNAPQIQAEKLEEETAAGTDEAGKPVEPENTAQMPEIEPEKTGTVFEGENYGTETDAKNTETKSAKTEDTGAESAVTENSEIENTEQKNTGNGSNMPETLAAQTTGAENAGMENIETKNDEAEKSVSELAGEFIRETLKEPVYTANEPYLNNVAVFYDDKASFIDYTKNREYRCELEQLALNKEVNPAPNAAIAKNAVDIPTDEIAEILKMLNMIKGDVYFTTTSKSENIIKTFIESGVNFQIPLVTKEEAEGKKTLLVPLFGLSNIFSCPKCGQKEYFGGFHNKVLSLQCKSCASPMYPDIYEAQNLDTNSNPYYWIFALSLMSKADIWILINPPLEAGRKLTFEFLKASFEAARPKKVYILSKETTKREYYKQLFREISPDCVVKADFQTQDSLCEDFINCEMSAVRVSV